jgi:hypothetical protein
MFDNAIYILSVGTSLLVLFVIIHMLRSERFKERHAVIWLFAGISSLVLSLFPSILIGLANLLGFAVPANLLFFVSLILLFLTALQASTELTKLEDNARVLAEKIAILEYRVKALEKKNNNDVG